MDRAEAAGNEGFQSAVKAAQKAALDCGPLPLPAHKYDQWQTLTLRLDLRQAQTQ